MNKETLQARLKLYQTEYEKAVGNANALRGAIQDVEFWLHELENPTEKVDASLVPPPAVKKVVENAAKQHKLSVVPGKGE